MTVLITGGTGLVGSHVIAEVLARGERVRTLSRRPDTSALPADVEVVAGSLSDTAAMRTALDGVDGLFLLSPVSLDELTGSLQTLDLARAAGVEAVVYLSVIHADIFTDPPHFAAKAAVEKAMADFGIHATVLRPGIYLQNDLALRDRLIHDGVYDPPVGNAAALFTDVGDLAEVAAARTAAPAGGARRARGDTSTSSPPDSGRRSDRGDLVGDPGTPNPVRRRRSRSDGGDLRRDPAKLACLRPAADVPALPA